MLARFQQTPSAFRETSRRINKVLMVMYILAIVSLVLEFGFYLAASTLQLIHNFELLVISMFVLQQFVKLTLAPHRREYFKERRIEYFATVALIVALATLPMLVKFTADGSGYLSITNIFALYIILAQIVISIDILSSIMRYSRRISSFRIQPARLFISSFVLVILSGSIFLTFPKATTNGISFIDALFTSASAVCVTGLIAVDTASAFTPLGKGIIVMLIQVGGLGVMTFTTFFALFSGRLSIKERVLMQEFLNKDSIGEIRKTLIHIIFLTLVIEAIGALLLYFSWGNYLFASNIDRIGSSIFHSVSAFCNAGFSLFQANLGDGRIAMNIPMNLTVSGLIIVGGLGFVVLENILRLRMSGRRSNRLSVHSRIVLTATTLLIVLGMVLFLLLEFNNSLGGLSFGDKVLASFFQSVTTRTAGFNTVSIAAMAVPATLLFLVLMFIGASPASTGGGIKTTTFSILFLAAINMVRGKNRIEIAHRRIHELSIDRAYATLVFTLVLVFLCVFFISLIEALPILDIVFEVVSAVGTVGLSRGITAVLTGTSKFVLVVAMLIGRVGVITVVMALTRLETGTNYDYPTENILVG